MFVGCHGSTFAEQHDDASVVPWLPPVQCRSSDAHETVSGERRTWNLELHKRQTFQRLRLKFFNLGIL